MSHVTVISTPNFVDQETLVAALKSLGYNPQVFEVAQALKGYAGDETNIKCEIVIDGNSIGDLSSDWGFKRVQGAFESHIDFWYEDSSEDLVNSLNRAYASEETKAVLTAQGFKWESTQDEEGNEQFVITTVGAYGTAGLDSLGPSDQAPGGGNWSQWG